MSTSLKLKPAALIATQVALCAALIGSASAAFAAPNRSPDKFQQCVDRWRGAPIGGGDLDSMGVSEYSVAVGRCLHLQPRGSW
jgi:hypothetical protein